MANTRSGGAPKDGAGDTGAGTSTRKASAAAAAASAAKAKDAKPTAASTSSAAARGTRSSSAREARGAETPTTLRRSNRETRGKKSSATATTSHNSARGSSSSGSSCRDAARKSPATKVKGLTELTGEPGTARKSNRVKKNGISTSSHSKYVNGNGNSSPVATPKKIDKRQIDVQNSVKKHDDTPSGSSPLKKQKRLNTNSNIEEKAKSPVLPTPLRMDEDNASKLAVEDNASVTGYEGSDAEQDNQERLSECVNKLFEGYTSDQAASISE